VATSGKRLLAVFLLTTAVGGGLGLAATASAGKSWCRARSGVAWRRVLSHHVVPLSRTTPLVPLALAGDGRSFFAEVYSPGFSGVARIDARTGALKRIKAFPDPRFDQAWGAFDGRWLVWNEYRGFSSFNDFTTWAWDTHSRKLSQLGAATRAPGGRYWDSPWRGADVRDGIATWVQGVGPDQLGEVHAYNLRDGRNLVVRRGHPGGAFLLDHHIVIWAEASAPGAPTRMQAASAITGASVPVPRALQSLRNVTGLQTDGHRIAYPNAAYKSLWWSPTPEETPYEVVATHDLNHIDNSVQVGGRYVGFGVYPRVLVADPKVGRYVQVATHGGSVFVNSTTLLVVYGPRKKVLHPILRVAFVRQRELPPMPACR
jgi:hypothetical protein